MFEDAAHHLDVLIATEIGHTSGSTQLQSGTEFQHYIEKRQQITALTEQVNELEDEVELYESLVTWNTLRGEEEDEDPAIATMRKEIETLKKKAADTV